VELVAIHAAVQPLGELLGEALVLQLLAAIGLVLRLWLVERARIRVIRLIQQLPVLRAALVVEELLQERPVLPLAVRGEEPDAARVAHQNPELVRHASRLLWKERWGPGARRA